MKRLLCFALCFIFISSCKKNADKTEAANNPVAGKWRIFEQYFSPGYPVDWTPFVTGLPAIIEFKANGELTCTSGFPESGKQYNRYVFVPGTNPNQPGTIEVSSTQNSNTANWRLWALSTDEMDLSIYFCYEGCAYRLERID